MIRLRNEYRRQFQRTGDLSKKFLVALFSKTIGKRMELLRNESFRNDISNLPDYSRPFWKVSKILKSKPKQIPPLKTSADAPLLITPSEKVNAIGEHFLSSHLLGSCMQSPLESRVAQSIQELDASEAAVEHMITPEQITSVLKGSKNMKAPGFDGIFNIVMKRLSFKVIRLLANIFSTCLEIHYFPSMWKTAKVIPIIKPGKDPTSPASYRPISLLSAISKIFERLILDRLLEEVCRNNILPPEQFGFRKGHSTVHQLQRVTNTIKQNKQVSKSTAMCLLDVEKAFDNVWHDGLVYKLRHFDISPYLIKIIRNYLKDRRYKVSLYGVNSNTFSIPAGVPQGSLLGPVLYNIYTSDVPQLPDAGVLAFFADDTAVMVKGRKPCEHRHRL